MAWKHGWFSHLSITIVALLVLHTPCFKSDGVRGDLPKFRPSFPLVKDEWAVAGKNKKLLCYVQNSEVVKEYIWYKNGKIIKTAPSKRMRVKLWRYLKIKKIVKKDAGKYMCVAKNDFGKINATIILHVQVPSRLPINESVKAAPRFLDLSKMQKKYIAVPVGNNIKMDCTAIGNPKPTILWYMNGKVFKDRGGDPYEQDPYKHVIILKDSVPDDSGRYTCNVSNPYGWINYTYRVDVQERIKARPILQPVANATVYEGQNATLKCLAMSDSMPHFQWLKWNPKPINNSGDVTKFLEHYNHYEVIKQKSYGIDRNLLKPPSKRPFAPHGVRLTLVNVTKKDEGQYTCLVGNSAGYDAKHTYVIVRAVPSRSPINESVKDARPTETASQVHPRGQDVNLLVIALAILAAIIAAFVIGLASLFCYSKWLRRKAKHKLEIVHLQRLTETKNCKNNDYYIIN